MSVLPNFFFCKHLNHLSLFGGIRGDYGVQGKGNSEVVIPSVQKKSDKLKNNFYNFSFLATSIHR